MARLPRIVIPGIPHHVTQRGNRREQVFFEESDYALYRDLLGEACRRNGACVWSYCLMPNHVHLILVPSSPENLGKALGETHRRYVGFINARNRVTGHLFQGRFGSVAMDEDHLLAAIRYVALNPVAANLVREASEWRWSSVRAHLTGHDDELVKVQPVLQRVPDFREFLKTELAADRINALRLGQSIGRPLMSEEALRELERRFLRKILPGRPGRRSKAATVGQLELMQ